jgi:hypothetical protein
MNRVMHHPKAGIRETLVVHPVPFATSSQRGFLLGSADAEAR